MCGIVAAVSRGDVVPNLMEGLRRVEYRGYDSAGISLVSQGIIASRRAVGKLSALKALVAEEPVSGMTGIGHTRWATHGKATIANAHPHATDQVSVVHNGIIENFQELKAQCQAHGMVFGSETDTEVVAKLLDLALAQGMPPFDAFKHVLQQLEGAYALAVIFAQDDGLILGARKGSPLALGISEDGHYLGSDGLALSHVCHQICFLDEGDMAVIRVDHASIFDAQGHQVSRPAVPVQSGHAIVERGPYKHFMAKEMHEQPDVVGQTLSRHVDPSNFEARDPELIAELAGLESMSLIACGTAYYAGLLGKYWLEEYANLPTESEIASEFRYRAHASKNGGGAMVVSQSGETSDSLAAMHHAKSMGMKLAGIVNVPQSSMARDVDILFPTFAGAEIGVASTKAFTCQMAVLAGLSILTGRARGHLHKDQAQNLLAELFALPRLLGDVLKIEDQLVPVARQLAGAKSMLFLGRNIFFPMAMEGALKLKELSYIHAEGYPAGELKHGPIALIEEAVPVVALLHQEVQADKTISNLEEVHARGAHVVAIGDEASLAKVTLAGASLIKLPPCTKIQAAFAMAIPMQMLAYHVAVAKGTDVDQPRNLAKSVTVE